MVNKIKMYASKCCNKARNLYLHNVITLVVILYTSSRVLANSTRSENIENKTNNCSFYDYLKQFEPKTVRSNLRNGRRSIRTDEEFVDAMIEGMDATDALLSLDIEKILVPKQNVTRRNDPGFTKNLMVINNFFYDPLNYRKRIHELMKQAIYQARNEMPIWQDMRKRYREHKLYKMGFLMSKTDNAVKIFTQFIYRSFKLCHMVRWHRVDQMYFYQVLLLHERALGLWFNAQLLTDLVLKNDRSCRNTSTYHKDYLLENWKYFD